MSRFVELSHVLRDGLIGYPGLPPVQVRPWMTHEASRPKYDGQAEFTITEFSMAGNAGIYLDSPYHRDPGGVDVSGLGIGMLAGLEGVVLDGIVGEDRAVRFHGLPDVEGKAVLVRHRLVHALRHRRLLGAGALPRLVDAGRAARGQARIGRGGLRQRRRHG